MPAGPDKIGDWTTTTLVKFIQDILRNNPPKFTASQSIETLTVSDQITVTDQMQFMRSQTTVGAAGGASALPATPAGYIFILDPTNTERVIPYYVKG